jgi:hypothetical protein
MPDYPSLIVSMYDMRGDPNTRPVFEACGGYFWCPGVGCIPNGTPCGDDPIA